MHDETTLRTDSAAYNAGTRANQLAHEEKSACENYHVIAQAYKDGRARDLNDEPKANGAPCMIIGSGASLDLALPLLHKWKGGIICTSSHARTLYKFGAPPTHILALDPFCTWEEVEGPDWSKTKTKLITVPTVWPTLIANWPNEMLMYRQNLGRRDIYYASTLNHMYSDRVGFRNCTFNFMIRTEITLFACSPPLQMFAAQIMGYGNIFLVGCDFAYTYDKDRFTDWTVSKPATLFSPAKWEEHVHTYDGLDAKTKSETLLTVNGLKAHTVHAYYKKNMISAWRLSMQDVWTTDKGAITEMPYIDIGHTIMKQGAHIKGAIPPLEKEKRAEEYLALVGAFVVKPTNGFVFIEVAEPDKDLPDYMRKMNREYVCQECKVGLQSDKDDDQTGEECPVCKKRALMRRNYCDIDANMARVHDRLKAAAKVKARMEAARAKG